MLSQQDILNSSQNEPKFKNQRWTKVIKIGVQASNQIHIHQLQEDWDYL